MDLSTDVVWFLGGSSMGEGNTPEVRDGTLSVRISENHSSCTLALGGELDLANAETLAAELAKVERRGARLIVLDLTELDFIDSTGIALIVSAHHRLNNGTDESFQLVGSDGEAVRRVLEVTGLDTGLPFIEPAP
jgi:anti-sigma B factor antagonist